MISVYVRVFLYIVSAITIYLGTFLTLSYFSFTVNSSLSNGISRFIEGLFLIVPVIMIQNKLIKAPSISMKRGGIYLLIATIFYFLTLIFWDGIIFKIRNVTIYELLGSVILTPIVEEIISRGVPLEYLKQKTADKSEWVMIIFTSVLFSIAHLPNLYTTISMLLFGIILAKVYLFERNIMYPILMHSCYNFLVIFLG